MRLCSQLHLALVEASSKICLFFLRSLWLLDDLLHGMSALLALLVHWDHWPQFLSDLAINVNAIDCVETHFSSITLSREAGVALVAVKHPTNHIFS